MIPGIATISAPTPLDYRRAIITQVHHARDMLSLAERQADSPDPQPGAALIQVGSALSSLTSARSLLHEAAAEPSLRIETLIRRGIPAAQAARGHIERYQLYLAGETKLERDQIKKLRPIWRRAAYEAKKDVHRALLFLCERWPEAYEREEDDKDFVECPECDGGREYPFHNCGTCKGERKVSR